MTTDVRDTLAYREFKLALGYLGLSLPSLLYFGWIIDLGILTSGTKYKGSISAYYYTNMKWFFVGYLVVMAIVLMIYKGDSTKENLLGWFAGVCALGVAIFPTKAPLELDTNLRVIAHYVSTALLYASLAWFSYHYFPEDEVDAINPKRVKKRNKAYKILGLLTFLFLLTLIVTSILANYDIVNPPDGWTLVFETLTNTSFGLAWAIKGQGLWKFNDDNKLNTPLEVIGAVANVFLIALYILMIGHIAYFTIT